MASFDPYAVLQVSPTAEQEVLNAAFRALAMKYHPDRQAGRIAARRMAELNAAWELVRDAATREAFDRGRRRPAATPSTTIPGVIIPPDTTGPGTRLDFGRYAGWRLRDVVRQDSEYLKWFARSASGKQYRNEILDLLARQGIAAA